MAETGVCHWLGQTPSMETLETNLICPKNGLDDGEHLNQPQNYLRWLVSELVQDKFFVFLVPPDYAHRQEYERRKAIFYAENPNHGIHFVEITWLDVCAVLDETGLSATSVYAQDFKNLLEGWYVPTPITFTPDELREIYHRHYQDL